MPRGWISRFKKSHDLEICTLPTCRGTLGDGIRQKNSPTGSIFSLEFTNLKIQGFFWKKYKDIKMPRGWISRLKKSHDLEICTRPTCRGILGDGIRKKKKF